MSAEELRLAHISDLHFASDWPWPPPAEREQEDWAVRLTHLKRDLLEQKPHALMVTGDIADNAAWELTDGDLGQAWDNALDFLHDVVDGLHPGERDDRIFVVPGNHDVRVLGNISRARLQQVSANRFFRWARWPMGWVTRRLLRHYGCREVIPQVESLFDRRLPGLLEHLATESTLFKAKFGRYAQSRPAPALNAYVFCVDSNADDALLTFAQGQVRGDEANRMLDQAAEWRKDPGYSQAHKLVLLHHHPLPMAFGSAGNDPRETDAFSLMRNAGSFVRLCAGLGIDFVLHGHKHVDGTATLSLPQDGEDSRRSLVVAGAGSVQQPHLHRLSYNVIERLGDGSWKLEVRAFVNADGQILPYGPHRTVTLVTAGAAHQRASQSLADGRNKDKALDIERIDVFAEIDEVGDLYRWAHYSSLRPLRGECRSYPLVIVNESKTASFEPLNFANTSTEANILRGELRWQPPATAGRPKDLEIGLRGVGVYTSSQEYCQAHKGTDREEYAFQARSNECVGVLRIEVVLPDELFNVPGYQLEATADVLSPSPVLKLTPADVATAPHRLVADGKLVLDASETARASGAIRVWPREHRIEMQVPRPLPGRMYRVLWTLPRDEYAVLDEAVRERARSAIAALCERLHGLEHGQEERRKVRAFLEEVGRVFLGSETGEDLRVDLATRSGDGGVEVVSAVQCEASGTWTRSALRPRCRLGEMSRGKAYLQRQPVGFDPGKAENAKDPHRDPIEQTTRHQLAIPLVWPPYLPGFPRVGVLTFSSESANSLLFAKFLARNAKPALMATLIKEVHEALARLASGLGGPDLPPIGPASPPGRARRATGGRAAAGLTRFRGDANVGKGARHDADRQGAEEQSGRDRLREGDLDRHALFPAGAGSRRQEGCGEEGRSPDRNASIAVSPG